MPDRRPRRPLTALGVLTTAAGLILFAWWIRRTGVGEIRAEFRQIGWGLLLIVLLGGLRFAVRAGAWTLCLERPHRLRFDRAFAAVVAGDALGNLLPLGPVISEPTKVAFVRGHISVAAAATALAIENVFYTLSVAAMIGAGMTTLLLWFQVPLLVREVSGIAIGTIALLFVSVWLVVRTRPAIAARLARVLPGSLARLLRTDRLAGQEQQIYTFFSRRPGTVLTLVSAEVLFHSLGVLEAYITLWLLLGSPPPFVTAFIVETVNRLITVVFKFMPLQPGVSEAGTALVTGVLQLGTTTGTTIALVRKVRLLCWTAVGTGLLIHRGLTARRILADTKGLSGNE